MLSIAYNPGEQLPTIINLYPDWNETGEVHIKYVHIDELVEAARLLNFIVDAVADELLDAKKAREKRESGRTSDIPF